jgi:DNA-binding transcriptional MerR regulator
MTHDEISLSELSSRAAVEIRTLRSWINEGLLLPPSRQGRGATYPRANLTRALAIRAMREIDGLGLPEIRRRLWEMSDGEVAEKADLFEGRTQKLNSASDYVLGLLSREEPSSAREPSGTALLIAKLSAGRGTAVSGSKPRAETMTIVPVTPDISLHVRGELSAETRTDFETIADLIRATLMKEPPSV